MTWKQYDRLREEDEQRDDHISPTSYLGQKLARGVSTVAHVTNFKHQLETRAEYKDRRDREHQEEIDSCYHAVDLRDHSVCRVTGEFLIAGHADPKKRKERHHMIRRSRGGSHETWNVLTVSAYIHQLDHAGKIRLSGNANLIDRDGMFCGVKYEVITDSGWKVERML
jgi:hypothetical protein